MKRLLAFILLLAYSVTTLGANVRLYYCMGKITGWSSLIATQSKECCVCVKGKEKKSFGSCCKNESRLLKIQDIRKANYVSFQISKLAVCTALPACHDPVSPVYTTNIFSAQNNDPPLTNGPEIYKLNCVFLI